MYAEQNQEYVPRYSDDGTQIHSDSNRFYYWDGLINLTLGNDYADHDNPLSANAALFVCPADTFARSAEVDPPRSYAIVAHQVAGSTPRVLGQYKNPSLNGIICEAHRQYSHYNRNLANTGYIKGSRTASSEAAKGYYRSSWNAAMLGPHAGFGNFIFVDGHVESYRYPDAPQSFFANSEDVKQ